MNAKTKGAEQNLSFSSLRGPPLLTKVGVIFVLGLLAYDAIAVGIYLKTLGKVRRSWTVGT